MDRRKNRQCQRTLGKKRGLSIPDEVWEPFVAFVASLEFQNGSRKVSVSNSRIAELGFRFVQALGADNVWKWLRRPELQTDDSWDRVGQALKNWQWPEQNDQPER